MSVEILVLVFEWRSFAIRMWGIFHASSLLRFFKLFLISQLFPLSSFLFQCINLINKPFLTAIFPSTLPLLPLHYLNLTPIIIQLILTSIWISLSLFRHCLLWHFWKWKPSIIGVIAIIVLSKKGIICGKIAHLALFFLYNFDVSLVV